MYCPSCRGEYREGFSWCKDCDVALIEALPDEPPEAEDLSDEEDLAEAEELAAGPEAGIPVLAAEKRLRTLELLLVLFVAFGTPIFFSLQDWWHGAPVTTNYPVRVQLGWSLHSLSYLCVLAYVLFRQGRGLRQLGLTASLWDIPTTVLLTAFTFAPYILVDRYFCEFRYAGAFAHPLTSFSGGLTLGPLLILTLLISAACEELIVRAYLMTEVEALTGQAIFAVLASTVFQLLYHLYQGTAELLPTALSFLICSIYYAYNRQAIPLILSHFLYNFLLYGSRAHGG